MAAKDQQRQLAKAILKRNLRELRLCPCRTGGRECMHCKRRKVIVTTAKHILGLGVQPRA